MGAGTEYLYGLLTELLGNDKEYVIESPGYKKLVQVYRQRGIECRFASLDMEGVTVNGLEQSGADVAHICPNHHFPTGITMPASRRYEVLAWANEKMEDISSRMIMTVNSERKESRFRHCSPLMPVKK